MHERVATTPDGVGWLDCVTVVTDRLMGDPCRTFWRHARAEREARRRNAVRPPTVWGFAYEWCTVPRGRRWAIVAFETDVVLVAR